jgi:Tol biopolymer transport system component
MPISPGHHIGPYEILAPIGHGGMGEVWRARDPKLDREVAIKVLPAGFANDPERLSRFTREAKVLASLNHPHIAQIFGLEESDNTGALVMEFVPGSTLECPVDLETAIDYARQIAEALEAAHEKGITHRDLKPGNVMVTPDGVIKVLDFGLATAPAHDANSVDPNNSPTTLAATRMGVILGTAAYMSPEQASGKPVDKRSDIWSFGVVLFEMLSGTKLFDGETVTDTIAEVLRGPIDLNRLPADTPRWLRRLIERCLDRNSKTRLRDIGEARILLQHPPAEETGSVAAQRFAKYERIAWLVAALLLLTTATAGFTLWRRPAVAAPPLNLSVKLPPDAVVGFLALSPDGRQIVFEILGPTGGVFLHSLDSPELKRLDTGGGIRAPFWSPDSKMIGFYQGGNKLSIIPAAGGPVQTLCDGATLPGTGGTWSRDGVILFSPFGPGKPIRRVNASGGECRDVMKPDGDTSYGYPAFLPDGKHFLLFVGGEEARRGIAWASLDDPTPHRLLPDAAAPVYAPSATGDKGYILFLRNNMEMAQPFDPDKLQLEGDAFAVSQGGTYDQNLPQTLVGASNNGILAVGHYPSWDRRLVWVDRTGKELGALGSDLRNNSVVLSPDGKTAMTSFEFKGISLYDATTGAATEFASPNMRGTGPIFSGDGSMIAYQSGNGIYARSMAGGAETLLIRNDLLKVPSSWSRDMRYMMYTQLEADGTYGIWYLEDPLGAKKAVRISAPGVRESEAMLSPDGRWLIYTAVQATGSDVYLRAFPSGSGPWKVSTNHGRLAQWRADGKEIFYLQLPAKLALMASAVRFDARSGAVVNPPKALFDFPSGTAQVYQNVARFSPSPDGQRFLILAPGQTEASLNILSNWEQMARK